MATRTLTLTASSTTWADSRDGKRGKNYSKSTSMGLKSSDAMAYIYHAVNIPRGATVTSAVLDVYTNSSWGGGTPTLAAQRISQKWTLSKLKWNNKPGVSGPTAVETESMGGPGIKVSLDVTDIIQDVADGSVWYGLRLVTDSSSLRYLKSGRHSNAAHRPRLTITYHEDPDKPTTFIPGAGAVVSEQKPRVGTVFVDKGGSIGAINVQTNSTNSFSGSQWDSGWVTTSTAMLDLGTTSFPGDSEGDLVYWRVRVRDTAGNESPWSEVSTFTWEALDTVTITNPPVAPDNVVFDSTPPLSWTFSGTQTAHQVIVFNNTTGREVWNSGYTPGTDTTVNPEAGKILDTTGSITYRVEIRVWDDNESRQGTTDSPAYASATRTFTVSETDTVAAVTDLTYTLLGEAGTVQLDWDRSSMPDEWSIRRDGREIAKLDGGDLLVSGTSYRYYDRAARPRVSHEWDVRAVVNAEASESGGTVTASYNTIGVWLITPELEDPSMDIFMTKTSSSSFELMEEAATLLPIGASDPIRITQSQRGYEGEVSGFILGDQYGVTLQDNVDRVLRLRKATKDRAVRMILKTGDNAIECYVGNVTIRAMSDTGANMREVAFDYWQVNNAAYFDRD